MIEVGLVVARFLQYAAAMAFFGASLFPLYAYSGRTDAAPSWLCTWLPRVQFLLALAALVSGIFWLAFVAANMADEAPWTEHPLGDIVKDPRQDVDDPVAVVITVAVVVFLEMV